jgi:hypothetical protein
MHTIGVVSASDYEAVDAALLALAFARERAEAAQRHVLPGTAADVLLRAEETLRNLYLELQQATYVPAPAAAQLELAG